MIKKFSLFLLFFISIFCFKNTYSDSEYIYESNNLQNCNFSEIYHINEYYSVRHFTYMSDQTKNVGRTQLIKNGEIVDYHDNIFFAINGANRDGIGPCVRYSKINEIYLDDNGIISINYRFWNSTSFGNQTKNVKFNINKKDISKLSLNIGVFGYGDHFLIKLKMFDKNISEAIHISTKSHIDKNWSGTNASTSNSWLYPTTYFWHSGCSIINIENNIDDYLINYKCIVNYTASNSGVGGPGGTNTREITGSFKLEKNNYNLCPYSEEYCENQSIQIPTPTNLKQYVKSPLLQKEEIDLGSKIGKFQSGSGVILSADFVNENNSEIKLLVEIYEHGKLFPKEMALSQSTNESNGTLEVTVPYLGAGDYTWKAKIIDNDGNESEVVDYSTNQSWEIDFSLFEGFEPYPYGFSFVNSSPDYSLLTGGISGKDNFWKGDNRKKDDGTKWEIMDMIFPLETFNGDERQYIAAFETIGLNNKRPSIFNGNCFGLSLSSLTQYHKPEILKNNFSSFSNNIGYGSIFDKINIENDVNNGYKWVGLDDNIKSILALQLYQKEANYSEMVKLSLDNQSANEILEILKINPGKHIISFYGKTGCNFLGMGCTDVGHAVIPYKVEGNKIYIWDNNVPYPFFKNNYGLKFYGYKQYIEIDIINNSFKAPFYDWNKFEKIGIVSIEDTFTNNTSIIGFNDTDTLYTLNGTSDLLITDIQGNKTGYKDGEIYEEIPGTRIISELNGAIEENTWKQIYLPQKLDNLTIEINGKIYENYDLMIAGGDYYTKLEGINIFSGQTDVFNISRENIKIDFDNNKTENNSYNILVDDFQNNSTGSIYLHQLETIKEKQELNIDWNKVINNENDSIKYALDTNNDGNYNQESYFNSIPKTENEVGSISGYLHGINAPGNSNMAGWKIYIDDNNDSKLQENKERFVVTDNKGYYEFKDLEKGDYKLRIVMKPNWEQIRSVNNYFDIKLNNGQKFKDLNFEVVRSNGKGNNK